MAPVQQVETAVGKDDFIALFLPFPEDARKPLASLYF
jgi:hypothetical protein